MTALQVLCVGAGYFAQFHHEAWRRMPGVELAGVADPDLERAEATGAVAFPSQAAALEVISPDIIDIAAPPSAHAFLIAEALAVVPRAIICQKPFATSVEEGAALAKAADDAGIPLIIHENFRFQPWYRKAKQLLTDQVLGDLHQVTFRFRTGDGQGPDAYLARQPYFQKMPRLLIHETAVHWVDTFRYLLGPIQGVYADLRRMNPVIAGEDAGHVIFSFDGDVRAVFDGNRHLDHATNNPRLTFGEALFEGTKGSLSLLGDGSLNFRPFGAQRSETVLPAKNWSGFAGDCVYALQEHVVLALKGQADFENLASDYLGVREVEEAIYLSNMEKRWVAV
ncbi:MAG: Gfo/Idh/MocA family oxidoreductase [Pseudomonadota bacterium]